MMASPGRSDLAVRPAGLAAGPGRDFNPEDSYFEALEEPFGNCAVDLSIGPIRMRLGGLAPGQSESLRKRYLPFTAEPDESGHGDADREPDLVIGLWRTGVEQFLRIDPGVPEVYRMGRRRSGTRLVLWSYEFAGWVDSGCRRAALALVDRDGPRFDRGLENFLRVMTASFILDRGGLLVHGAGVVRGGRAYVFFGPSGSGKTTVTRLSKDDTIMSDDLTLIVPTSGGYGAAGIPFGMAHHQTPQTNGTFPLDSLNRLVQSDVMGAEPIEGARAVAELSASLPFVMQDADRASRALETARRILERVPARRLRFRRDASFWRLLERR